MIAEYRHKRNRFVWAMVGFLVLRLCAIPFIGQQDPINPYAAYTAAFSYGATYVCYMGACFVYGRAKGYSWLAGTWGFLSVFGVIVLWALTDQTEVSQTDRTPSWEDR